VSITFIYRLFQDEREMYFGKIFGIAAICESGMMTRPSTTKSDVINIVTALKKYSQEKSYLRECCFSLILSCISSVSILKK